MRIIADKKNMFILFLSLFVTPIFSQNSKTTLTEDSEFQRLLNEKRRINTSITVNDRYKILIYNGDNENAKKNLFELKKENKNVDATIIFVNPNYRVVTGNYKTKIEAEKALLDLQKKYPNALIIKPNK